MRLINGSANVLFTSSIWYHDKYSLPQWMGSGIRSDLPRFISWLYGVCPGRGCDDEDGIGFGFGFGDSDWPHRRHNRSRRLQERIDGVSTRLVPTVKLVMKLATLLLPFPPTRRSIRLTSTSSMDWQTSHTHQLLRVNWRHCTNHTNAFNYMATPGKHKK